MGKQRGRGFTFSPVLMNELKAIAVKKLFIESNTINFYIYSFTLIAHSPPQLICNLRHKNP